MGDYREFWIATLFVVIGLFLAAGICEATPIREWIGLLKFTIVVVGGFGIGQLLILIYCCVYILVERIFSRRK